MQAARRNRQLVTWSNVASFCTILACFQCRWLIERAPLSDNMTKKPHRTTVLSCVSVCSGAHSVRRNPSHRIGRSLYTLVPLSQSRTSLGGPRVSG
ncbi:Uncharacterized protein HZ326_31645, partial [Fusarium oxysporum f. sp. albedinis]